MPSLRKNEKTVSFPGNIFSRAEYLDFSQEQIFRNARKLNVLRGKSFVNFKKDPQVNRNCFR